MLHRMNTKPRMAIMKTGGGIRALPGSPGHCHAMIPVQAQGCDRPTGQPRIDVPFRAMSIARVKAAAGIAPVDLSPEAITGTWILRFGMFGAPDHETRGGVITIGSNRIAGGDSNFLYSGECALDGTELSALIEIVRHGADPYLQTLFGTDEDSYRVDCTAEAITPDLFEGRIRRPGFPDARVTLTRFHASPKAANDARR